MKNNDFWWWTFHGRHYWCIYIVTFVDRHHFRWAMVTYNSLHHQKNERHQRWHRRNYVLWWHSRYVMNNDYNGKQWLSPFHINNNDLWWQTFLGHHYWCIYMVAYIDYHHFIFSWGSKNVTISSLVRVEKCHHKLISDGQKSLYHHSIWISGHDGIEPPTSYL